MSSICRTSTTRQGDACLGAVIDGWICDIDADVSSDRCRTVEATAALERAMLGLLRRRLSEGHELTVRVDRGSQFRAHRFRETAR